jgi:peptidoglycan/LPS O-acetylase OafA/YrhL
LTPLTNPRLAEVPAEIRTSKPGQTSGRIAVVDGLRGVAILAVVFYHIQLYALTSGTALWERVYHDAAGSGWAGVDLFFVLSGFLITGILFQSRDRKDYYRVFYARRTLRIFPLYYLSLLLFFGVAPLVLKLMHHDAAISRLIQPESQIFAWSYILNWRIGLASSFFVVPIFIQHFWSLSIEEQFYLCWPFVIRTLAHRGLIIACAALVAASLAARVAFMHFHMITSAYVLTFCRLDGLAIGAVIALAIRRAHYWRAVRKAAPLLTAAVLVGLVIVERVAGDVGVYTFWMCTVGISLWSLFFGGCLVMLVHAQEGFVYRIASSRVLRFFGKYSYCLYVCQQPLIVVLVRAGLTGDNLTRTFHSKIAAAVAMNCIVLLLAVAISLASWHLFEKHFLKLKEVSFRNSAS